MIRIDNSTAVAVRPTIDAAGTPNWWTNGDPGIPTPATIIEADFLNDLQAILMAVFTAGGITPTKGPGGDDDLLDSINALVNFGLPINTLVGHLKRTAAGIIQLQPICGPDVLVGINNKVYSNSGALEFNMASHLETGEAPSTAYYLYVREDSGSLDVQISATVPDLPGDTKPGYKSGDATRRCIGGFWNDEGQDIPEQSWGPGGEVLVHDRPGDFGYVVSTAAVSVWTSVALNLPLCASAVRVLSMLENTDTSLHWAPSDASTNPTQDKDITSAGHREIYARATALQMQQTVYPIADMTAPALSYHNINDSVDSNALAVCGWTDIFAPR